MARFSNSSGSLHLNVYIDQASQSIASNHSTVNWRVTVSRTGAYYTHNHQGDSTLVVTIDGAQVHSSNPRWATSGEEVQLASGSRTIGHNADGTKSVSISANFNPNNGVHGRIITNGSLGLTTIPRSSSVSVGSGTIGSNLTININRQSSSFKHTVRYAWANKSGTIATNVDTSTSWTIPLDFANNIPNATSGTGTIFVDTYSGSTLTGTQSVQFTAGVPDSVRPNLTGFTLVDGNAAARQLIPGGQQFVQVISNIAVHFGQASGSYGSTIAGYHAEIVGKNQSTNQNGGSLGLMNYHGAITIRARVTDSRGRVSDTIERTVTVLEYFAPALNFSIARTGVSSSTFTVTRNARVAPLRVGNSQKNSMTLSFKVAQLGTSAFTPDNGPAAGTWTSLSELINSRANLSGSYAANRSWVVLGVLEDKFTRTEFIANVATEAVVFYYEKDGRVGVGKIAENGPAGSLDVAGNIYAGGQQVQQYQMTSNVGGGISVPGSFGKDLNNILTPGVWQVGADFANNPLGAFCILECYKLHTSNECIQRVTSTNGFMAVREYGYDNVWRPWRYIAQTSDAPTKNADHPALKIWPLKSITQGFPYGLNAALTRKGDLVTITLNRRITNIDVFEYRQMLETIPVGYRPTTETHMVIVPNSGSSTKSPSILHLAADGKIRLTNGTSGQHVYTGTITYITADPYPA